MLGVAPHQHQASGRPDNQNEIPPNGNPERFEAGYRALEPTEARKAFSFVAQYTDVAGLGSMLRERVVYRRNPLEHAAQPSAVAQITKA